MSNQTLDVDEDIVNKAYRPVASGRISLRDALRLRWTLVPVCVAFSLPFGPIAILASFLVAISTILHNELGLHSRSWIVRNFLNGLGLASYELGATAVIGKPLYI